MTREDLRQGVEKELTGKEEEPQPIYLKNYKSQIPVIEHAIEKAAQMLDAHKSRGLCLKMIQADVLAAAHLDNGSGDSERNLIMLCNACHAAAHRIT